MTFAKRFMLLALPLCLMGCAGSGGSRLADNVDVLGAPDAITYAQLEVEEYRLGPQDKVSITVYPVKEYSLPNARVAGDGSVLVPPLGLLRAQGKTTAAFAAEIKAGLTACCLKNPEVVVQLEETMSRQITVTGAVKTANVYNLRGRTTLLQAISMAGGVDSATANLKRVGVIRMVNGQRTGKVFNLLDIQAGRAADPDVFGGDQIIVDTSDRKSAWRTVLSAIPITSFFAVF